MATAEALGQNVDSLVINRSSIHRERSKLRKKQAINLCQGFQINLFNISVIHWDGKLLPSLTSKNLVDRFPVIISCGNHEQLLSVPKLLVGTEEQAINVYQLIEEWGLNNSVIVACCDTTASNKGRLKVACVLLEQSLEKDLLYLLCRHHIYELVLRSVFEEKFGSASGPNIQLFKKFQDNWNKIDTVQFTPGIENYDVSLILCHNVQQRVLDFALTHSKEKQFREDYRELLELSIIFLGVITHRGISFRVPGASHHARWMSKAIYCLKIYNFRKKFHMTKTQENACRDTCIFIISVYIEK